MDSGHDKSSSESGYEVRKIKATGGWLEHLPPRVIEGILGNRKKYKEAESSNWSKMLPSEIIQEILVRLPITYVVQCSLVCKSFAKLAMSPSFALMHLKNRFDDSPFLIFHSKYGSSPNYLGCLNIDSLDGYEAMVKRINVPFRHLMLEYMIVGSCYGYLCLVSHDVKLSMPGLILFNPLTMHFKALPELSRLTDGFFAYGFGYHVGTGEYKVLLATYVNKYLVQYRRERLGFGFDRENELEVQILTTRASRWRTLRTPSCWFSDPGTPFVYQQRGLWVSGSLHWLTSRTISMSEDSEPMEVRQVIAFDLAAEEFGEIIPPSGVSYLLAISGNLSAVVNHEQGTWEIWVMKEYGVQGSWSKEFVLGHYVPAAMRNCESSSGNYQMNAKVVCCLKNGNILLQFECKAWEANTNKEYKAWCYYDPETELYKDLTLHRLPESCETVPHIGSMILIDAEAQI